MSLQIIPVYVNHSYNVYYGKNIIDEVIELNKDSFKNCKVGIITDTTVSELHINIVERKLKNIGLSPIMIAFPNNESIKTLEIISSITQSLFDSRFSQSDIIIGIGGGTVLDVAGFVAASYLGGIPLVQIPTTYVSAIEMTVTRKYNINESIHKDLLSLLAIPTIVVIESTFFETLGKIDLTRGQIAALKYAFISDKALLEQIKKEDFKYIIPRCISIKKSLLQTYSPNNDGLSQLLNFGTLLGGIIESASGYGIDYANALAIAMCLETQGGNRIKKTNSDVYSELKKTLEYIGVYFDGKLDKRELVDMYEIKLRFENGMASIPIVEEIGKCKLHQITKSDLVQYI